MDELEVFIENLELSLPDESYSFAVKAPEAEGGLEGTESETGFLNYRSLQSFVAGVSGQSRDDLLNSMLLAQRGANFLFPDDARVMDWYNKYFEILAMIGWVIESREFEYFNSSTSLFEIDKALLDILTVALTGNQLAILAKTIESFKSLGDEDRRVTAFEKYTHSLQQGSFQLGASSEVNGAISVSGSAFILNTSKKIKKILFFNSDKEATEFKYRYIKATLNSGVYEKIRESIIKKLDDVSSYIAELEI